MDKPKRVAEAVERANAMCVGAAVEHSRTHAHAVRLLPGCGWMCDACDPDLIDQFAHVPSVVIAR